MPIELRHPNALRSGAFRFALALALVFATGSAILLWVVHQQVGGFAGQAAESMLRSETVILTGEYRELGLSGLTDALDRHTKADTEAPYRYLLLDAQGRRIFGDLPAAGVHAGWGDIVVGEDTGGTSSLRMLGTRLDGGLLLVVATDAFDIDTLGTRLTDFTLAGGLAITLFALIGGYVAGRIFLSRLDRINHAVTAIVDGDRRTLPAIGVGPEFDQLTGNLNMMLERKADAMEALRQVSTAIAHDLRTPLTRLKQGLETLRDDEGAETAKIDDVVAQADEILGTFQALLRIGMLEGGAGRQRFTQVDLSEVANRVCEVYAPVAEDADHTLTWQITSDLVINGDAELLAQLMTNLIENAIVHTPAGTQIAVSLAEDGDCAILRVQDDGPGVSSSDLEKIFRRFYRGDASRSSHGSGLGLSLVAAIAELHGEPPRAISSQAGLAIEIPFKLRTP